MPPNASTPPLPVPTVLLSSSVDLDLVSAGISASRSSWCAPFPLILAEDGGCGSSSGGGDRSLRGVDWREAVASALSVVVDGGGWCVALGEVALSSSSSSSRCGISSGASFSSASAM